MTITALIIVFVALLLLTVPVGVILLIISLVPNLFVNRFAISPEYLLRNFVTAFDNTTLLAIPLFIIAGVIMAKGQISKKIYDVFAYFFGSLPGGMPCAVVITCLFYGAISGSGPATTAAVGSMTIPILLQLGYNLPFCAALVAVAGGLGVIIPPSIPFIVYSTSSGTSVGDMFIAGIIPGVLIGLFLIIYVVLYVKKNGEDKLKINTMVNQLRGGGFFKIFKEGFWALLSPVIILGGIYSGIFTPTEAACVSVVYSIIVSVFIYKSMSWKDVISAFVESATTISSCLIIIGAATIFAKCVTFLRIPQQLEVALGGIATNRVLFLLLCNVVFLIAGCLLDTTAAILILSPILLPLAKIAGINLIHFGIVMVVNLAIGFVTPPVGINLYVASSLTKVPPMVIIKKALPMLAMFFAALILITYVESISLCLLS